MKARALFDTTMRFKQGFCLQRQLMENIETVSFLPILQFSRPVSGPKNVTSIYVSNTNK